MPDLCNIDGRIVPEAEAVVPVLDRGFLFGDSVYEVFRTRSGVPFAWREHLERLHVSAGAIGMKIGIPDRELMERVAATVSASRSAPDEESYIRLIVTRGTASAPNIDVATATGPLRVVVIVRKLSLDRIGCAVRCALVGRHAPIGQGADPAVKSGNYVTNIVGLAEAKRRGADDCIFVDGTGHVTEASTANLYAVLDGTVCTAPVGSGLLAGITRRLLIDCATALGLTIVERPIAREELTRADEAFLSGTVRDLSPITHIDGRELSGGSGGPITQRLQREFAAFCDRRSIEDRGALRDVGVSP